MFLLKMKSITTKVDSSKRPGESKLACILHNMFRSGSKRVLAEAEEENNSSAKKTTVSDIISTQGKKNTSTASSRGKILSHVFRKKFVFDGARKSRLLLLRRISAKKRAEKRSKREEGNVVDTELCKRRILMGMKCKPVNASGKLHYGQDGVILHEE